MEQNNYDRPCLVDTGRGFSVSYQNKFLYSKYAPDRAIKNIIASLQILPGTLFLACSPLLWYGLSELLEKLPENCFIIAVELDKNLHEFAKSQLEKLCSDATSSVLKKIQSQVIILPYEANEYIVNILTSEDFPSKKEIESLLPHISNFRRAIPIEMSAGFQSKKEEYMTIANLAQNTIASFWKNRITLTKLGRLYARNIFKNLTNLPDSIDFKSLIHKIEKPIFVFGAGESIETTIQNVPKNLLEKCFIIAVDAVSSSLKAYGITPDAICAVEGQLAIEKAYIGGNAKNSLIIADISSRKQVTKHTNLAVTYIASKYTDAKFFTLLSKNEFFPKSVPALGSVGLTSVYIALLLRKNINVPVLVSGLDFSFSSGKTHAKNTPAHISRLIYSNRFNPVENYAASFKNGACKIIGKNNIPVFTDTALLSYAKSFSDVFKQEANLYDTGCQGVQLELQSLSSKKLNAYLSTIEYNSEKTCISFQKEHKSDYSEKIRLFLETEEKALNRIKELLMFGNDVAGCSKTIEEELEELISPREYLFLHFPDGYKCDTTSLSFLKRVRSQIDFFLKDIKQALKNL